MKYFAICPVCGKRLCKAEEGSTVDIQCPDCKEQVEIIVTRETVSTKHSLQKEQKAAVQDTANTIKYGFIRKEVPKQNTTVEPSGKVTFVKSCLYRNINRNSLTDR